jgi:hypothetical protein
MPNITITPQTTLVTVNTQTTQLTVSQTGTQGPPGISAATSLSAMSDVTVTGPTNNQFLKYNGTKWTNVNTEILDGGNF